MADNVTVSNNSGSNPGDYVVETDDIGSGVESQIVGLRWGVKDGTVRVSAAAPLPVVQTGTPALPTGAATEVTLASILARFPASLGQKAMAASLAVTIASDQGAVPVSGPLTDTQLRATAVPVSGTVTTGGLTDTQLRATAVPVSGTVTTTPPANATTNVAQFGGTNVSTGTGTGGAGIPRVTVSSDSFPASQAVTGTFFQGTQPVSIAATVAVSGPLTDTQLRASAVPVSLASTTVTGSVAVTGPLTDAQLRATAVPVSGSVTATGPLTDTQLRATPVPVSGTITATVGSVGAEGATTEPSVNMVGGWDGLNLRSAKVQNRNGDNVQFTYSPEQQRILEQLLIEIQAQNGLLPVPSITGALPVTISPDITGGYSVYRLLATATTNANTVKNTAGKLFGWYLKNTAGYDVFLKFYNARQAPNVGVDIPFMTVGIPAGAGANVEYVGGIAFSQGISFTITKLVADTDATVVAANDLIVNLFYK